MKHTDFDPLTDKIDYLLAGFDKISVENQYLRQQLAKMAQEQAALIHKNEHAIAEIKNIITTLRERLE